MNKENCMWTVRVYQPHVLTNMQTGELLALRVSQYEH